MGILITKDMIHQAYEVGKAVNEGSLTRSEGKMRIQQLSGMSEGSANDYIQILSCMLKGAVYKRTMNFESTKYFLDQIGEDYGREKQIIAARATIDHTEYYASLGYGRRKNIKELAEQYLP